MAIRSGGSVIGLVIAKPGEGMSLPAVSRKRVAVGCKPMFSVGAGAVALREANSVAGKQARLRVGAVMQSRGLPRRVAGREAAQAAGRRSRP